MQRLHVLSSTVLAIALMAGCARPTPPPSTGSLVTAEVPPDMLEQARADLAQRAGISAGDAKVVRAESVNWPNGALGCEQPGQMYTQMIVPGYVIELEHGGRTYSYHAARQGAPQFCESPTTRQGTDAR